MMSNLEQDAVEKALMTASAYYNDAVYAVTDPSTGKTEFQVSFDDLYDVVQKADTYSTTQERQEALDKDISAFQASGDVAVVEYLKDIQYIEVNEIAPEISKLQNAQSLEAPEVTAVKLDQTARASAPDFSATLDSRADDYSR